MLSRPMASEEAWGRIFGYVLMNDWSAQDVQKWEYIRSDVGPASRPAAMMTIPSRPRRRCPREVPVAAPRS